MGRGEMGRWKGNRRGDRILREGRWGGGTRGEKIPKAVAVAAHGRGHLAQTHVSVCRGPGPRELVVSLALRAFRWHSGDEDPMAGPVLTTVPRDGHPGESHPQ